MADERKPPPRRPRDMHDDEVVEIPPTERVPRLPPRPQEPFARVAPTQTENIREVLAVQRKMALQLDGFGALMNRRLDLFHEELALQRATGEETNARLDTLLALVKGDHGPRIAKVESTLGQKVAKGGGIVGLVVVALPLLSEVLPKWAGLFERIGALLQ